MSNPSSSTRQTLAPAQSKHLPQHNRGCSWPCLLPVVALRYKSVAKCLQTPSLHPHDKPFQAQLTEESLLFPETQVATMVSARRLARLAKKWQRMVVLGRKRLTWSSVALEKETKGSCSMSYSVVPGNG
ncbi:hypothetical protein D1007_60837 [Hordeum vulgare]|nr:hypothetical protein D1007_60837 [Hordeum vulgare]